MVGRQVQGAMACILRKAHGVRHLDLFNRYIR